MKRLGKWNSRKLFALIGTIAVGILYPPIVPLLTIGSPTYLAVQGAVDIVKALKGVDKD